jgi:hypothetical protein
MQTTGPNGKMTVTVPPIGALLLEAANPIVLTSPPKPRVKVRLDLYTSLYAVNASVTGTQPLTIAFAVKRAHSSIWRRLDVGDSLALSRLPRSGEVQKGREAGSGRERTQPERQDRDIGRRHVPDAVPLSGRARGRPVRSRDGGTTVRRLRAWHRVTRLPRAGSRPGPVGRAARRSHRLAA